MKVDFYRHQLTGADAQAVAQVLESPFLTTGAISHGVEDQLRDYFCLPHAVLVNSWTNGALATLLALEIGPGDEVIVPAQTFVATANVVELVGAKVQLVDVDPATLLMTPEFAARAITPRTRAVIPVHLYGRMVDVAALRNAINNAGQGQKISILEDCAHCFEGSLNGARPGTYSDAALFSFYATKNVTCGEGGAVVMRDEALWRRLLETRLHGMSATAIDRFRGGRYNHWDMQSLGVKANIPDLLAALLPPQIAQIDARLGERHVLVERYDRGLAGTGVRRPSQISGAVDASHLYTIGINNRDQVIALLNEAGISVTVNFRAIPDLTYYRTRYPDTTQMCTEAVKWGRQTISLPLYPGLPRKQQDHVIETLLGLLADPAFQLEN